MLAANPSPRGEGESCLQARPGWGGSPMLFAEAPRFRPTRAGADAPVSALPSRGGIRALRRPGSPRNERSEDRCDEGQGRGADPSGFQLELRSALAPPALRREAVVAGRAA